nr:hypothetical protein [uncultured Mucilaginibacter sp.]
MKRNLHTVIIAVILVGTLSSCTRRYYAPGLFQNDVQLMMKPHSQDSAKSKVYINGALLTQSGASGQGNSTSGLLNVYRSHTLQNFNLSYGALAYTGNYTRDINTGGSNNTPAEHISKSFSGYGFNGSASVYFSSGKVDFRVLGADVVYTHEGGDYLAFRKSVYGHADVFSSPRAEMFTYGIFTEYVFHLQPQLNFGFKFFFNKVTGQVNRDLQDYGNGFNTFGSSVFAEFNRINVHGTFSFNSNNGAVGAGSQLGVGYSF